MWGGQGELIALAVVGQVSIVAQGTLCVSFISGSVGDPNTSIDSVQRLWPAPQSWVLTEGCQFTVIATCSVNRGRIYFLSPWTPDLSSTPYDVEDNNGPFSGQVTHAVQQWPLSCRLTGPLACCCSCRASPPSHISQMLSTTIKPMNWNRIGRRTSNVTVASPVHQREYMPCFLTTYIHPCVHVDSY
ncbi:hypothetical protein CIRG_00138 [Coccidioides immitis RMSCC 2394]|uniref:Uncharacterized protein n=1 Tax=Coccidioides immitis RMSCC 2394 TaxID=404692 RepID=A0A0J6XV35_COCIT|nr:hypothetical protein CIRG_00138 [Coccidioides immitis RMSCC 2394]